jgi:hypothetical protein
MFSHRSPLLFRPVNGSAANSIIRRRGRKHSLAGGRGHFEDFTFLLRVRLGIRVDWTGDWIESISKPSQIDFRKALDNLNECIIVSHTSESHELTIPKRAAQTTTRADVRAGSDYCKS